MPSRQDRRKAERDAAERAPAKAGAAYATGAAGAAGTAGATEAAAAARASGAAAALAILNVSTLGDWTTQSDSPVALCEAVGMAVESGGLTQVTGRRRVTCSGSPASGTHNEMECPYRAEKTTALCCVER